MSQKTDFPTFSQYSLDWLGAVLTLKSGLLSRCVIIHWNRCIATIFHIIRANLTAVISHFLQDYEFQFKLKSPIENRTDSGWIRILRWPQFYASIGTGVSKATNSFLFLNFFFFCCKGTKFSWGPLSCILALPPAPYPNNHPGYSLDPIRLSPTLTAAWTWFVFSLSMFWQWS